MSKVSFKAVMALPVLSTTSLLELSTTESLEGPVQMSCHLPVWVCFILFLVLILLLFSSSEASETKHRYGKVNIPETQETPTAIKAGLSRLLIIYILHLLMNG